MTHVFVYGTLMRGGANHAVLARLGARYVASARTVRGRTLVDLGPYPALLPYDEKRDALAPNVHGEIYEIDDAALADLDEFEGCPTLYTRARIKLTTGADAIEAWAYVFARPVPRAAQPVSTGRYDKTGETLAEGADASQLEDD